MQLYWQKMLLKYVSRISELPLYKLGWRSSPGRVLVSGLLGHKSRVHVCTTVFQLEAVAEQVADLAELKTPYVTGEFWRVN